MRSILKLFSALIIGTTLVATPSFAKTYSKQTAAANCKQTISIDRRISGCTKLLKKEPKNITYLNRRGLAHYHNGDIDKAIADYTTALAVTSTDFLHNNRGSAYLKKGKQDAAYYDKAYEEFSEAIALNPNLAMFYYNRGIVQGNRGDIEKAIADYTSAINIKTTHIKARYKRAQLYVKQGRVAEALPDVEMLVALHPEDKKSQKLRREVRKALAMASASKT